MSNKKKHVNDVIGEVVVVQAPPQEVSNPKNSGGMARSSIIVAIISTLGMVAVSAMELINKPTDSLPKDIVQGREIVRIDTELRELRRRVQEVDQMCYERIEKFRWMHNYDESANESMMAPADDEFMDDLSEYTPESYGEATGEVLAYAPAPPPERGDGGNILDELFDSTAAATPPSGSNSYEDYLAMAEKYNVEKPKGIYRDTRDKPLIGWVYLGQLNDAKDGWTVSTIARNPSRIPPGVGDEVLLEEGTFIRERKPWPIIGYKGSPIGPEVLFPGSRLTILEVDHEVGLLSKTSWAKVDVLYEAF